MVLVSFGFMGKNDVPNPFIFFEGFFEILKIVSENRTRMIAMTFQISKEFSFEEYKIQINGTLGFLSHELDEFFVVRVFFQIGFESVFKVESGPLSLIFL